MIALPTPVYRLKDSQLDKIVVSIIIIIIYLFFDNVQSIFQIIGWEAICFLNYPKIASLTRCCMNSIYSQFLRYITRQAFIVYRLLDAAHIGNIFCDPLFFNCYSWVTLCSKLLICVVWSVPKKVFFFFCHMLKGIGWPVPFPFLANLDHFG